MKRFITPLAALLLLAGSAFAFLAVPGWKIKDNYEIKFSSGDVGGIFKKFGGTILFDEHNPAASRFDVNLDVSSLNTGNALQNKHAKSDEWFDAAKYPQIRFTSKSIGKTAGGYQVTGDLEMHGVRKTITFPFTFVQNSGGGVFTSAFTVNRNDYHIGKPGGDVEDAIKVEISVPVSK
jgi:polyisoprenoid-binding protein YceI